MPDRLFFFAVLTACGAGWGLTVPLIKIAVGTGHGHFGLIFWQMCLGAAFLAVINLVRGVALLPNRKQLAFAFLIAIIGTVVPNSASYASAVHLPGGVMALIIALVPIFSFPTAMVMGNERFAWRRLTGVALGAVAIALLVMPGTASLGAALVPFVALGLLAPFLYGLEGNIVARHGTFGLDPLQLLCAASWSGATIALVLALVFDQFIDPRPPWGAPEAALAAIALIHALVYSTYVWLVFRAGPVFTSQVSYLVTAFALVWAMLILGEQHPTTIWIASGLLFGALLLVQPKSR